MIDWLKKAILKADDRIASLMAVLIVSITVWGVFTRFVLNQPLKWMEEGALSLFVWLTFIGASSVMKNDGHVSIDLLLEKAPERFRKVLLLIKYVVMLAAVILIFVVLGFQLSVNAGDKILPILKIPYSYIDFAVPLGGLLALIHLIRLIVRTLKS
ncbi:TRAP transporter small permease [Paenibacillus alkalitolerans]|uniref:TRAP transporter small permease n=1 Tax=Paenibacillus alkalitolerans TaxID=2799335 RepID=UPI0018F63D64|nr:TRAP transporter small permease [Paenibacillus alkalitolerans]